MIRGYFSSLSKHEEKFVSDFPKVTLQTRHRYLVRCLVTLFMLYGDLTLMPSSLRAGLGPTGVFAAGYRKFPPHLRIALETCMNAVKLIYHDAADRGGANIRAKRLKAKRKRPFGSVAKM
jgi:hypothetical protein